MQNGKCNFPDGFCSPVIDKCEGCKNVDVYDNITYCRAYMKPEAKWIDGRCPLCTVKIVIVQKDEKKLNPLKASKKAAKARKAAKATTKK